eukprot:4320406-Prymnesium_polylepis.2
MRCAAEWVQARAVIDQQPRRMHGASAHAARGRCGAQWERGEAAPTLDAPSEGMRRPIAASESSRARHTESIGSSSAASPTVSLSTVEPRPRAPSPSVLALECPLSAGLGLGSNALNDSANSCSSAKSSSDSVTCRPTDRPTDRE